METKTVMSNELGVMNASEAIKEFFGIESKPDVLEKIDKIIEISIKSDFVNEYGLSSEIGLLFDLKRMIISL